MMGSLVSHLLALFHTIPMSSVAKRLTAGTAANFLGKFWVLAIQLISIPILTQKWGIEGYGVWLMLITIPTYIALSDLGMGAAAGVEITKKIANSDYRGALAVFQSVWIALTVSMSLIAAFIIAYALNTYFGEGGNIGGFTRQELAIAIVLITLYAGFIVQMSIINTIFRATHKLALGTFVLDSLLPIEGAALIGIIWFGGGLVEATSGLLVLRIIGWLVFKHLLQTKEPWLRIGLKHANWTVLHPLLEPSFATLALMLATALLLQGVILTLGWGAGPAVVAIFGTTRMLTRIPLQFANLVWRSSIPELTRSLESKNTNLTRKLIKANVLFALIVSALPLIFLAITGPQFLLYISKGTLLASPTLFALLSLGAFLNAIWSALASPLMASNRQALFSYFYLVLCMAVVVAPLITPSTIVLAVTLTIAELMVFGRVAILNRSCRIGK